MKHNYEKPTVEYVNFQSQEITTDGDNTGLDDGFSDVEDSVEDGW